jgi:hypothetical protein
MKRAKEISFDLREIKLFEYSVIKNEISFKEIT